MPENNNGSGVDRECLDGPIEVGVREGYFSSGLGHLVGEDLPLALAQPGPGPVEADAVGPSGLVVVVLNRAPMLIGPGHGFVGGLRGQVTVSQREGEGPEQVLTALPIESLKGGVL